MKRPALGRSGGFSLVELMVSVVVGLLALLFALRLFTGNEATRQSSLGGSDAMQNGMLALFSLSGEAEQAGFGLNDPIIAGCNTAFSDTQGYALAAATRGGAAIHPLAPVVIESNGAAPDRISFYSGSSLAGTGTVRVLADYSAGTRVQVDRLPWGFKPKDVIVVAPEQANGTCALAQLSGVASVADNPKFLDFAPDGMRFNSGSLGAAFTGGAARVFNLGPAASLSLHTWSVADGYLRLFGTGDAASSEAPVTVSDSIVSIKAQYGFDKRVGNAFQPDAGLRVSQWSATVVDADGSGTAGDAGDWQRIAAVRLAVVARSKAPENAGAGSACTATTSQPTVFAAAVPAGVAAVPVTVDVAVAGDPVHWHCYRYRVFETVVNLRNAGWRPPP
ncbi:PilW family protein [Massilia sp. TN1-12]|uniref:PilW family protein n=1 Tax=Massilia paldalensis TaxID=3377675 RepID=UPI00384C3AC9